jgi:flavin reductase (DIM6/NTAB) family NADH-FMN oxidoreductase RutF
MNSPGVQKSAYSVPADRIPPSTVVGGAALRAMMAHFPTGVTIVGARGRDGDQGMTANSVTCVSLDPPLVSVCLTRDSRTEQAVSQSEGFALTFLSKQQAELASHFARPNEDHFHDVAARRTAHGHPYFPDGLGFLECATVYQIDAGDHRVIIGLVTESGLSGGDPLVFFRSRFSAIAASGDGRTTPDTEEQQ